MTANDDGLWLFHGRACGFSKGTLNASFDYNGTQF